MSPISLLSLKFVLSEGNHFIYVFEVLYVFYFLTTSIGYPFYELDFTRDREVLLLVLRAEVTFMMIVN